MRCQGYSDLSALTEDERISVIGRVVDANRQITGFTVGVAMEDDKKKIDKYVRKLLDRFPELVVRSKEKGLVPNTVLLRVGAKPFEPPPGMAG